MVPFVLSLFAAWRVSVPGHLTAARLGPWTGLLKLLQLNDSNKKMRGGNSKNSVFQGNYDWVLGFCAAFGRLGMGGSRRTYEWVEATWVDVVCDPASFEGQRPLQSQWKSLGKERSICGSEWVNVTLIAWPLITTSVVIKGQFYVRIYWCKVDRMIKLVLAIRNAQ